MPSHDIAERVAGWARDEAQQHSFTDDVGTAVHWRLKTVQTSTGPLPAVQWAILVTIPSHLAGVEPYGKPFVLDMISPDEQRVRAVVAATVEALRQYRTQQNALPQNLGKRLQSGLAKGSG